MKNASRFRHRNRFNTQAKRLPLLHSIQSRLKSTLFSYRLRVHVRAWNLWTFQRETLERARAANTRGGLGVGCAPSPPGTPAMSPHSWRGAVSREASALRKWMPHSRRLCLFDFRMEMTFEAGNTPPHSRDPKVVDLVGVKGNGSDRIVCSCRWDFPNRQLLCNVRISWFVRFPISEFDFNLNVACHVLFCR